MASIGDNLNESLSLPSFSTLSTLSTNKRSRFTDEETQETPKKSQKVAIKNNKLTQTSTIEATYDQDHSHIEINQNDLGHNSKISVSGEAQSATSICNNKVNGSIESVIEMNSTKENKFIFYVYPDTKREEKAIESYSTNQPIRSVNVIHNTNVEKDAKISIKTTLDSSQVLTNASLEKGAEINMVTNGGNQYLNDVQLGKGSGIFMGTNLTVEQQLAAVAWFNGK